MNGTCAAAAVARPSVSSIRSVAPSSTARAMEGNGLSFTGIQLLGILGYAISVPGSPNPRRTPERRRRKIDAFEWPARLGQLARLDLVNCF